MPANPGDEIATNDVVRRDRFIEGPRDTLDQHSVMLVTNGSGPMMNASNHIRFQAPSQMSAEALEAIFVQPESMAALVVDIVVASATSGAERHALLVGRGRIHRQVGG
ncbi:MAG: hypothetical protein MUF01_12780 [Bryobacterales bacterium]|jgi:hypothetical protein|nr:hypothetical protein [Bryobacterales bacterium]